MTSEYIASKLALLPQFKVIAIDHESEERGLDMLLKGSFSHPLELHEQGATLFAGDLRTIYGNVLEATADDVIRTFQQRPYWPTEITPDELKNAPLAYFGQYDERHLRLVLDPGFTWNELVYAARPAIQSRVIGTDGQPLRKLEEFVEGDTVPEGSTIIEGGWDHEHCSFCWNKIREGDVGYHCVSDTGWACPWCFENAIRLQDPRPLLIPYDDRK